jgi:hypothetical protein
VAAYSTHVTSTIERQQATNTVSMDKFCWSVGNLLVELMPLHTNTSLVVAAPMLAVRRLASRVEHGHV